MAMEETGGEVDVVKETDSGFLFYDCSLESPTGRRSLSYDVEAWEKRKKNRPESSAEQRALDMGCEMMTEEEYLFLQSLGDFDVKSQSWLKTDKDFRKKGDALFGTKRHGRTFVFFNGTGSYYSNRGFRCQLEIEK